MKKILALILALTMAFTAFACAKPAEAPAATEAPVEAAATEAPAEPVVEEGFHPAADRLRLDVCRDRHQHRAEHRRLHDLPKTDRLRPHQRRGQRINASFRTGRPTLPFSTGMDFCMYLDSGGFAVYID